MRQNNNAVVLADPRGTPFDRAFWLLRITLFAALATLLAAGQTLARSAPESFADLAEKLLPTVVNISTTTIIEGGPGQDLEELFKDFLERRGDEHRQQRRPAFHRKRQGAGRKTHPSAEERSFDDTVTIVATGYGD